VTGAARDRSVTGAARDRSVTGAARDRSVTGAARIALVVGPDPGHALPVFGIGDALRRRGYEVTVWTGERHIELARRHDLVWRRLPLLAPQEGDDDLGQRLHGRAADMALALLPEVRAWGPDLFVVDTLTRAGALVAGVLATPYVEVVPHHLPDPAEDLPPIGLGRPLPRTPWRRLDDRFIVRQQLRSVAEGEAQAAEAARRCGLPTWPAPARRLLQTLPAIERPRARWPADAVVVGPLALDPPSTPLEPPEGDAPLVVVTDSTASGLERSLASTALVGLRGLDLRLVVTTSALPPRRAPGLVVGVGPHGPLLTEAAVAVSPGGGGFVTKAAAAGTPQVIVPLAGDQREAAARLRDTGAARVIRPRRCTPRTLRWAVVRTLVDRGQRDAAARLAAQAARLGPEVAADRCLDVLAGAAARGA
jgi:UDP:flavonoid glycosyltransferase YjiC (YdhE family)